VLPAASSAEPSEQSQGSYSLEYVIVFANRSTKEEKKFLDTVNRLRKRKRENLNGLLILRKLRGYER